MKTITKKTTLFAAMALIVVSAAITSFTTKPGGEGFEIYLNSKLLLQRFGNELNSVQSVQLDQRYSTAQLSIKYHHCGKVGKSRYVAIKDAQNNLLKEWHFEDVKDAYAAMNFSVKDILAVQKGSRANTVNLYYSSSELPKGRMLASIVLPAKNAVAAK
jgi:hypothetical protein